MTVHTKARLFGREAFAKLLGIRAHSGSTTASSLLLRDYIKDRLYHPDEGYFQKHEAPVSHLPAPITFGRLLGRTEYLRTVKEAYRALQVSWLTPSEIFSPLYGRAVAALLLKQHDPSRGPLRICEIGGGSGTLALDILDFVQQAASPVYHTCSYTSHEVSRALGRVQQDRVSYQNGHGNHFRVRIGDASDPKAWDSVDEHHCSILAMEVLDNCPHDRVFKDGEGHWRQEEVLADVNSPELTSNLVSDDVIRRVLDLALADSGPKGSFWQRSLDFLAGLPPKEASGNNNNNNNNNNTNDSSAMFLPTGSSLLLETVCHYRPNHDLLIADFDELPDVNIQGRNAPLVSATAAGSARDFETYLVGRGEADIFFPTDFELLSRMYESTCRSAGFWTRGKIVGTSDFMGRFADIGASRCKDGYSPLLEDYSNTKFFMGSCRRSEYS